MAGKKIALTFSDKTHELLERLVKETGLKKSTVVAVAIAEYADRKEHGRNHHD